MSNVLSISKKPCFQIPDNIFQEIVNGRFRNYKLKRNNRIGKTLRRQNSVERISLESVSFTKKIIRDYPETTALIETVIHAKGLEKLKLLTKSNRPIQTYQEKLRADINTKSYYQTDLSYIAKLSKEDLKEIDNRLDLFHKQLLKISPSREFAQDHFVENVRNPETYAKIARSIEFRKIGPKPNHVTEHLKKRGYTDENLKDFMSLSAMSAVCLTNEEYKRIQQYRRDCPFPDKAYKILTQNDYANYVNGEYKSIIGFWADAAHYEGVTTEKMIYDLLRLDYPDSEFNANAEKIYVMRFSPQVALEQAQIPFMNRIKIINDKGDLFNNVPGNPLTGHGNVATRENTLIPEYKATTRQPIPFIEEQTCIGYFDKTGKFHEEYMFYQGKWVDMKQYENHKEIQKLINVLEHRSADLMAKAKAPNKPSREALDR